MNLAQKFLDAACGHREKTAVFFGDLRLSYGDLVDETERLSRRLRLEQGLRPGERLGICLRNRPEFIAALLGALHAGAIVVPINSFLKEDEINYLLADAGVTSVITEAELEPLFHSWTAIHGAARLLSVDAPVAPAQAPRPQNLPPSPNRAEDDLAVLIYTSGTTGRPKGAMLTHGNLLQNIESCRQILEVVELDRFILVLPMFHSFMLTVCILLPLVTGGSIVLVKSLSPAKAMIAEIIQNEGTVLPAMAQVFRALAGLPEGVQLPLRLCISGAGPLPGEILRVFNRRFPEIPLIEGYGLSEASPVVSVNPVHGPAMAGTIGFPIPGVEVSIQDDEGRPLPDSVDGEICVRGGNVMRGYWNAPEKTAEVLRDGWLLTGDVGHRRPDGYLVITDRKKDMLKPNGMNVYPREIEEVLYQFPGIREAAVVGEPDERRGERPVAFVAVEENTAFDDRALLSFLKERLADYKLPKRAIQIASLPRNASGKILKTRLREILRQE